MANVSSSNGIEKCPKLRFNGFSDTWFFRSAESLFENVTDKNHPEETVLTIIQGAGTLPRGESSRNIRYDESGIANYKKVQTHDYIIHLRSFEGGLEMANSTGIISPAYTVLRPKGKVAPLFYEAYFHTDEFINHILAKSVEGIRDGRQISYEAFKWLKLPTCSFEEQKKIAELFRVLAIRINKQRELVSTLKKYKRGAINNIFNGYTFNESVKECLLSDVASFHQGLTYSPGDVSDMGYLVMRSSNIQNGRLSFKDNVYVKSRIPESLLVQENDVLMCVRNGSKQLVGKTAIIDQAYPNMTWGAFMMIIRSTLKNTFVYHYLNSDSFYNQVFRDSGTATINQITKGTLNECKLFIPSTEHQERICQYLDLLDRKLHKEQDYLENLGLLKQSLLQQLFI